MGSARRVLGLGRANFGIGQAQLDSASGQILSDLIRPPAWPGQPLHHVRHLRRRDGRSAQGSRGPADAAVQLGLPRRARVHFHVRERQGPRIALPWNVQCDGPADLHDRDGHPRDGGSAGRRGLAVGQCLHPSLCRADCGAVWPGHVALNHHLQFCERGARPQFHHVAAPARGEPRLQDLQ